MTISSSYWIMLGILAALAAFTNTVDWWLRRCERRSQRCSCGAYLCGSPVCYEHPRSGSEQK